MGGPALKGSPRSGLHLSSFSFETILSRTYLCWTRFCPGFSLIPRWISLMKLRIKGIVLVLFLRRNASHLRPWDFSYSTTVCVLRTLITRRASNVEPRRIGVLKPSKRAFLARKMVAQCRIRKHLPIEHVSCYDVVSTAPKQKYLECVVLQYEAPPRTQTTVFRFETPSLQMLLQNGTKSVSEVGGLRNQFFVRLDGLMVR